MDEAEFKRRFRTQFADQIFNDLAKELDAIADGAWDAYKNARKSPNTRKAGDDFEDPDYDLSLEWIRAREAIEQAQQGRDDSTRTSRILLINASPRSEYTCPGEMSKTYRLVEIASRVFQEDNVTVDLLDLSRVTSEYGRHIYPCKACFSTSPALCHWPCSCYPNYSLGQTQDWMNEIYPLWVAADGIMIVTPVHWYSPTSPLKLMMDRLVCADGGNPDPTSTSGKDARKAKTKELVGWNYPRHLAGRLFAVVVHGDTEGAENVRRCLSDWLQSMELLPAGRDAELDRYIGYWKPYATSHADLDADLAVQEEVRNAARILATAVSAKRTNLLVSAGQHFSQPRQK